MKKTDERALKPFALALSLQLVAAALPRDAAASPNLRTSPWNLVERADLIVLARVVRVEFDPTIDPSTSPPYSDEQVAILEVVEAWKGDPERTVTVHFELTAPASYDAGLVILAFLERGESRVRRWRDDVERQAVEDAKYRSMVLQDFPELDASYEEARVPPQTDDAIRRFEAWASGRWLESLTVEIVEDDTEEVTAFRDIVQAAVRLQSAGPVDDAAKRDWLVSVAEKRSAREGALVELVKDELHRDQLARLAASFVREPAIDLSDAFMLHMLSDYPDSGVDRTAAAVVEAMLRQQPIPSWSGIVMNETLQRYGARESDGAGAVSPNELSSFWEAARRERGIPAVPPAGPPPP